MIGFIGGGNMAEALVKGIVSRQRSGAGALFISEPNAERRRYLEQTYGVKATKLNKEVVSSCDIIILAVKPQIIEAVLDEIAGIVTEDKTVVSIAAGITLSYLASRLKTRKIIRVMPNTPALVQEGMSVMSLCECFSDKDIAIVRDIFMSVGKVATMPEKYMDAVTALSGSGPAFIAFFVECLIDAGVNMGMNRDVASELAMQTFIGTAKLIETGLPPDRVREMVTSPGGTTAAGLKMFEERGLKGIISEALLSAKRRAEELGGKQH